MSLGINKATRQDLIPDVGQLKPAQVPIEGWVIDPYEHGLLNGPGNAMHFPTQYGKTVIFIIEQA